MDPDKSLRQRGAGAGVWMHAVLAAAEARVAAGRSNAKRRWKHYPLIGAPPSSRPCGSYTGPMNKRGLPKPFRPLNLHAGF